MSKVSFFVCFSFLFFYPPKEINFHIHCSESSFWQLDVVIQFP